METQIDLKLEKTLTPLASGPFNERVDRTLLQRLLNSGLLHEGGNGGWMDDQYRCPEKTHLTKLMRCVRNGVLKVKYNKPKCGFGRVQPRGQFSLGSLRRAVRHTLCDGKYADFDIVNC